MLERGVILSRQFSHMHIFAKHQEVHRNTEPHIKSRSDATSWVEAVKCFCIYIYILYDTTSECLRLGINEAEYVL